MKYFFPGLILVSTIVLKLIILVNFSTVYKNFDSILTIEKAKKGFSGTGNRLLHSVMGNTPSTEQANEKRAPHNDELDSNLG